MAVDKACPGVEKRVIALVACQICISGPASGIYRHLIARGTGGADFDNHYSLYRYPNGRITSILDLEMSISNVAECSAVDNVLRVEAIKNWHVACRSFHRPPCMGKLVTTRTMTFKPPQTIGSQVDILKLPA